MAQFSRTEEIRMDQTRNKRLVSLTINNRAAFGDFCQSLADNNIKFSLGGLQTVFLSENQLEHLPSEPYELLCLMNGRSMLAVHQLGSRRRRHIPTQEETEELLWKLAGK